MGLQLQRQIDVLKHGRLSPSTQLHNAKRKSLHGTDKVAPTPRSFGEMGCKTMAAYRAESNDAQARVQKKIAAVRAKAAGIVPHSEDRPPSAAAQQDTNECGEIDHRMDDCMQEDAPAVGHAIEEELGSEDRPPSDAAQQDANECGEIDHRMDDYTPEDAPAVGHASEEELGHAISRSSESRSVRAVGGACEWGSGRAEGGAGVCRSADAAGNPHPHSPHPLSLSSAGAAKSADPESGHMLNKAAIASAAPAAAAAGTFTDESSLASVLHSVGLGSRLPEASAWCSSAGADEMGDLTDEDRQDLVAELQLPQIKARKLTAALQQTEQHPHAVAPVRSERAPAGQQEEPLSVKATFGEDIRRFPVGDLTELKCRVQELFQLSGPFDLKYKDDDGDLVAISSDSEFQEGIRIAFLNKPAVLHVRITAGQEVDAAMVVWRPTNSRRHWCSLS